ncbi:hypothetical protein H4217_005063 [Coemansia sp. RSA 1939]|nr:hypothetical protein H4217_005063 [Coemansia sp. RSA 1939]KAJ2607573.1 hypothetical protein EV177_005443 [Coemansia sp. RSA 1804]
MPSIRLTDEQLAFFRTRGYLVVPGFLSAHELSLYRAESETLVNHCYEQGDLVADWGCVVEPLGCGYFSDPEITAGVRTDRTRYTELRAHLSPCHLVRCTLDGFGHCAQQLLLHCSQRTASPPTASLLSDADTVFLLNEQYIVKPPRTRTEFAWHQDIVYFRSEERSHAVVSVWTPLDDVFVGNGTVWVDPFPDPDRPGCYAQGVAADTLPPGGSAGSGAAFAVELAAGTALFMDGRLRHCSTGNDSGRFRSVYMPQFSLGRVERPRPAGAKDADSACTAFAIPITNE